MVTFTLGGKDYGIDIMRVKEIAKFYDFTYVPNTAHFVRGVYNLRGDIISIIDLRSFFNLPISERAEGDPENGLILRLETNMLGIVVDSIDKVVGISSRQVQPPHPIFGDINVKYISGVAEHDERLYIILDVDRIFTREEEVDESQVSMQERLEQHQRESEPEQPKDTALERSLSPGRDAEKQTDDAEVQRRFLADGVQAFSSFFVSPVNHAWFVRRVDEWVSERKANGTEYQLKEPADAEEFLAPFYSRYTGSFWRDDYLEAFQSQLQSTEATVYQVWNPGCGSGHESYSIAASLRTRFPEKQIKIWAGDKDLLKISTAPNLVFARKEIPDEWEQFVVEGKNGIGFNSELKESVLFEFSDVLSAAAMPKLDLIVARDLLSLHKREDQDRVLERFDEMLKPGGRLILGDNEEVIQADAWEPVADGSLSVYIHQ